jgi:hypothetical protein
MNYSDETIYQDYEGKVLVNENYFHVYVTIVESKNYNNIELDLYVYEENEKDINESTLMDRIGMTYSQLFDHISDGILDGTYDDLEEVDAFH